MVRFVSIQSGAALFRADSRTRKGLTHYCAIDIETRAVSCTCEFCVHKVNGKGITTRDRSKKCWHIKNAAKNLSRRLRK